MRQLTGVGTPRSLQGRTAALLGALIDHLRDLGSRVRLFWWPDLAVVVRIDLIARLHQHVPIDLRKGAFATGS